jgi:DNA repair exonuclease SbcCD ATPase subunit
LTEQTAYGRSAGTAKDLRGQSDAWKRGKAAMLRLRVLVKQHLLPSLNAVASRLIEQMTGGQRRLIVVDDEFDISVDGQPLATLSGSGKAVANLALRIGLGQVLTNNILSLFSSRSRRR